MRGGTRSCAALLCACAAALGGAGCAGDGDDSAPQEAIAYSRASESPRVFMRRTAKLLETTRAEKDCGELVEINNRSFTRFPCPPAKSLSRSMAKFDVVDAEEYGTGAVVDYRSGEVPDGAAIVLYVAPDRNWGIARFGLITKPSTRTDDDESRHGYDRAVEDYLGAIRDRDCEAFRDVAFVGDSKGEEVCETLFAATEELAERLRENPSAGPRYEGGNATYGFYTLETAKPRPENSTIGVMRAGAGANERYLVLDVTPSPTAAEQRRVRREFERQQEEGNPNTISPDERESTGRKAD